MAGGVTGVYDPCPTGLSSISMGRGSAHGSISSGSSPESAGLRLTLCIPSSEREEAMVAYHKDPVKGHNPDKIQQNNQKDHLE